MKYPKPAPVLEYIEVSIEHYDRGLDKAFDSLFDEIFRRRGNNLLSSTSDVNIPSMKNSLKRGSIRTIIFKEADTWYAVGLEFNIVTEGDTPEMASFNLQESISGYVESLNKSNVGGLRTEAILNQKPDSEYEELWNKLEGNKPIPSPYHVHSFGRLLLNK